MKTTLAINGAAGRMGQRLVHLAHNDKHLVIGAALETLNHPHIDRDIGELCGLGTLHVPIRTALLPEQRIDALIDFSTPEGTMDVLPSCVTRRIPLVVATTGHTTEQKHRIEEAAHETALLMAPNMSLVVNVLFDLVGRAARLLHGKDFDVEIIEWHHRYKKDSPSGTALHFARLIEKVMGQTHLRHGREGNVGERPAKEIGMHAIRAGDNVGEHTILFSALGETLELVHRSSSRDSYARGALEAAKFLVGKPAGRYGMSDVLGL